MTAHVPQAALHLVRIDVLRAWAILLVFCHHYWIGVWPRVGGSGDAGAWEAWLWAPWAHGYLGVKLFFVISGFCIHLSFLNWHRQQPVTAPMWQPFLAGFFWRRFWRIYPPYLGALLVFYLIEYADPFSFHSLRHLAVHGFLLQNLSPAFFLNINASFWSISVEWQIYLIYPLFLWLALAWRIEGAVAAAAAVALLCHFVAPHFTNSYAVLHSPFAYWLEWVVGALIADYFVAGRRVFRAHAWLVPATGMAAVWALVASGSGVAKDLLPTLFFAVLLERCVVVKGPLARAGQWLVPIGLCSYSLYLWHGPYLAWLTARSAAWVKDAPGIVAWAVLPLTYALPLCAGCWFYYRWVERGCIDAGKRLWPWRTAKVRQKAAPPVSN